VLNWHLARGLVVFPKTQKIERLKENLNIFDFQMNPEDLLKLFKLETGFRVCDPKRWDVDEFNCTSLFA